jgi:L-lysine exporter family protein LysE/ArgO
MTVPFITGFVLSLSLILPIGAQNAFVLRSGLRGEHVLAVCLACAASDAALILAGVAGFARLATALPWAESAMRWLGAAFLAAYGARSLMAACRDAAAVTLDGAAPSGLRRVLLTCLAFTWLNPHVYLDTVVLIGSLSAQFDGARTAFALGAMLASLAFFFSLGYGARLLRPLFARPGAWRVLDAAIGLVMWVTAVGLVLG